MQILDWLKSDKESWADYGNNVHLLVEEAYTDLQMNMQEHLTLCHYFDQLKSPLIAEPIQPYYHRNHHIIRIIFA